MHLVFRRLLQLLTLLVLGFLTACSLPGKRTQAPDSWLQADQFSSLPGWHQDNLRETWPAFLASCEKMAKKPDWKTPCTAAQLVDASDVTAIRHYFESYFLPFQISNAEGQETGLMTGYYEPLLHGARHRGGAFQTPLHARPADLLAVDLTGIYPDQKGMRLRGKRVGPKILPYPARAEITASNAYDPYVLLWVDDPVEAFFLQVQGSGRVYLEDTQETIRLAYADQNGHPYQSIGRYLIDRGELPADQASAQHIKEWLAKHPERKNELFNANPSYIFFKEEKITDPTQGPKGALGIPLLAGRSVAVDPAYIALGSPVFLASTHPVDNAPLQRLTMAQDTGSAIKGSVRVDFFWGFGDEAGVVAGKTKQRVALWVLQPIKTAATQKQP